MPTVETAEDLTEAEAFMLTHDIDMDSRCADAVRDALTAKFAQVRIAELARVVKRLRELSKRQGRVDWSQMVTDIADLLEREGAGT